MDSDPPQAASLKYEPLRDTEIRLIKMTGNSPSTSREKMGRILLKLFAPTGVDPYTDEWQGESEPHTRPDMVLTLHHFELTSCPPFIALSYVWGEPAATGTIIIGGICIQVPRNLCDALAQIYDVSPTLHAGISSSSEASSTDKVELFLWVDSVCINQAYNAERSRQVPQMGNSSAYSVLVWLGDFERLERAEADIDPASAHRLLVDLMDVEELDGFPKLVEKWSAIWLPEVTYLDVLHAYGDLMRNSWFGRVWVSQEYALSRRRPSALIGSYLVSLTALDTWLKVMDAQIRARVTEPESTIMLETVRLMEWSKGKAWASAALRDQLCTPEFRTQSTAHQLVSLITKMGGKSATSPHDHIYGLLGMVDAGTLPRDLAPNYELPYARVFADYARFLIEQTGDLRLLMDRMFYPPCLDGAPSWVLNPSTYSANLSTEPEPQTRHIGAFSADGRILKAHGTKVAGVLRYYEFDRDDRDDHDLEPSLRAFYDGILTPSARIRAKPIEEIAREWLEGLFQDLPLALGTFFEIYPTVSDFFHRAVDRSHDADGDGETVFKFPVILPVVSSLDYLLLSDGRVAALHCCWGEAVEPGPQTAVWALKGSTRLSVLGAQDGGESYRYIGWLNLEVELDEEFFLGKEMSEIRLV